MHAETSALSEKERPRLRRDLEFTHREAGGAAEVIVCEPRTGRYLRAGALEAALFAMLDGETSWRRSPRSRCRLPTGSSGSPCTSRS